MRHCFVDAELQRGNAHKALDLLHRYEEEGRIAPLKSYEAVIERMLFPRKVDIFDHGSQQPSRARIHARALDLFAHVRYAAHPMPSLRLYTLMLLGCAFHPLGRVDSLRAADIWYEMRHTSNLTPDIDAYNAFMLCLARSSSEPLWRYECWRVAKELFSQTDLVPNERTYEALLSCSKRSGDLGKAKWAFAELLRRGLKVNERAIVDLFHCYSIFKPKLSPVLRTVSEVDSLENAGIPAEEQEVATVEKDNESSEEGSGNLPESLVLPSTREQILKEVTSLFDSLTANRSQTPHLRPPANLIASYLNVHIKHTRRQELARLRSLWESVWRNVEPDVTAYAAVFERCAQMPRGERNREYRRSALEWAKELWPGWLALEEKLRAMGPMPSSDARRVEKVWRSYITCYTK